MGQPRNRPIRGSAEQSGATDPVHLRAIRASYTAHTIRVYQAFNAEIADLALVSGLFDCPPFKRDRMTWIKPSYLWTMYRSGWSMKDQNQSRILAIDISRQGFEWALQHACLTTNEFGSFATRSEHKQALANSPVRVQWDPGRDINLQPTRRRAVQIGLSGDAVDRYVTEWIVAIEDVTADSLVIKSLVDGGQTKAAVELLPQEQTYPCPEHIAQLIAIGTS